jgi:lipid-A-disaccharide synthase
MRRLLIVSGESSGDRYGADLAEALFAQAQGRALHVQGIGGSRMAAAGVEIVLEAAHLGVVGIVEILKNYRALKAALEASKAQIIHNKPDLLVLIDHPEFNLRLAKVAKKHGIPVLYFISPQVWAWRPWRVKKIGQVIDGMAVIFPFEEAFYQKYGIPVRFVGHPLAERVQPSLSKAAAYTAFGLDPNRPVISLCPGSRRGEIQRLLPDFLKAAELLQARHPDWQFVLPQALSLKASDLAPFLAQSSLTVKVIPGQFYDLNQLASVAITASGTATLELGLLGIPMLICYRVAPLSYQIMKRLITVPHIGLVNIILQQRVVPEFVQQAVKAEVLAEATEKLFAGAEREQVLAALATLPDALGHGGAAQKLAAWCWEFLAAEGKTSFNE